MSAAALSAAYRGSGDLGSALAQFFRAPHDLGLFREPLYPASLKALLDEIADASGPAARKRRIALCERVLRACTDALEARYVVRLLSGELRIGLRAALVEDAIARAFEREPNAVRRATMAAGDLGAVAVAARRDELDDVAVRYGSPVAFMLATPLAYGEEYGELAAHDWLAEDKYDGIRAQAHKHGDDVHLYSRTLAAIDAAFPEVVDALHACAGDFILDGEIVAQRDGRVLPFRSLQARLGRKDPTPELRAEVPVAFVAFDALAAGDAFLLEQPLAERRAVLVSIVVEGAHLALAPAEPQHGDAASAAAVNALFARARERGHEGLVLKRADAPYVPGRRGKWWRKLKRELTTLDAVVVAVEWGHGKRHRVLSDYTFGVRAAEDDERLLTIGKAYSGLTDAEIAEMTEWFLAHRRGDARAFGFAVDPEIVVEIAFDIVAPSTLHDSGYALRFPRIVRLRPDKPAAEADTLAEVERVYAEMLARARAQP